MPFNSCSLRRRKRSWRIWGGKRWRSASWCGNKSKRSCSMC
jgi:hypothetical protein